MATYIRKNTAKTHYSIIIIINFVNTLTQYFSYLMRFL